MSPRIRAKVTSKGQITLPAALRKALKLRAGDDVTFVRDRQGRYLVEAKPASLQDLKGIIKDAEPVTGENVRGWIEDAKGRMPEGFKKRGER